MDNQHRKIQGYRELSQEEIDLMNEVKDAAKHTGELIQIMEDTPNMYDKRWLAIAKTDLQKGYMSLVRSIAQPTTF